jgi:hypothetical protein
MQRKRALHQGWFIGSGVVEAGCKNVVGKRLKQSGMFWSEPGATCVLNFHTSWLSNRFDSFSKRPPQRPRRQK